MIVPIKEFFNKYALIIIILIIIFIFIFTTNENFLNNINFNENAIVIVEPREHKLLKQVIDNFHSIMDKSWDLYVFHGKSHKEFADNATKDIKDRNKFLIPLDTDNLNANEYNRLFRNKSFWDNVKAEHILVFQTDTVLCKNSKYKIEDFMKYDYIGCPYNGTIIGKTGKVWGEDNYFYGIGGLSYRNKSFMIDCINKNSNVPPNSPEDVIFSNCVAESKNKPESAEVLNKFCTQFYGLDKSFGVHRPTHLADKETFSEYCPEINIL
jgi:hypothetical protein